MTDTLYMYHCIFNGQNESKHQSYLFCQENQQLLIVLKCAEYELKDLALVQGEIRSGWPLVQAEHHPLQKSTLLNLYRQWLQRFLFWWYLIHLDPATVFHVRSLPTKFLQLRIQDSCKELSTYISDPGKEQDNGIVPKECEKNDW